MEDTAAARKRTRTDQENEEGLSREEAKRDETIWFLDGNIILQAGGVAFRVYQGLLALNSEIFSDMFSVPQPESVETLEGCSVIHLADHPDDLRHLLRVLFIDKTFHRHNAQFPCSVVTVLVRLAHKYGIKDVLDDAMDRMKSCFSDNLHVWAQAEARGGSALMSYKQTDAIAAVNIARLTNTESMVPVGLYMCCQLKTEVLLNGITRENGTTERLASDDVVRCIDARKVLVHDNIISACRVFDPSSSAECSGTRCTTILKFFLECQVTYDGGLANYTCLGDWVSWLRIEEPSAWFGDLCHACKNMIEARAGAEREVIWSQLPDVMDGDSDSDDE